MLEQQTSSDRYPVQYRILRRPYDDGQASFDEIINVPDTEGLARSMTIDAAGVLYVLVQRTTGVYTIESFSDTLGFLSSTRLCYGANGESGVLYSRDSGNEGYLLDWISMMPDGTIHVGGVAIGRIQPYNYDYDYKQSYQAYLYTYSEDGVFFRNEIYAVGGNASCGLVGFCESTGIEPLLGESVCPQAHPTAQYQYPTGGVTTPSGYVAFTYAVSAEYLRRSGRMVAVDEAGVVYLFAQGGDVLDGAQLNDGGSDLTVRGVGAHVTSVDVVSTSVCLSSSQSCAEPLLTGPCLLDGECQSGVCGSNRNCCLSNCTSECATGGCSSTTGECEMKPILADASSSCSPLLGVLDSIVLADFDALNARQGTGE